MKGKQISPTQISPSSFDFVIRPLALSVKNLPEGIYHLEFEKGPQHVRILQQCIMLGPSKDFIFENPEETIIKLHNPKCSSFSWSLYRNHEEKSEYIDSVRFNLTEIYANFAKDLKTYSSEYSHLLGVRAKNEPVGFLWSGLKMKMKNSSVVSQASNEGGWIRLKYGLEIKGEIDYISSKEVVKSVKSKLSSRGSIESQMKNSESRKSLLAKKVQNVWVNEKIEENDIKELKIDSIIKEDPQPLIQEINEKPFSIQIKESISYVPNTPSDVPAVEKAQTKSSKPYIPRLQVNFERTTILSDIPQNSCDGSSNLPSGQQSDRKYKQLSVMPENTVNENSFVKRKTYTFQAIKPDEGPLRRINTHQSINHSSQLDQEEEQEIERHEREAYSLMKKRQNQAESNENGLQSSLKPSNISLSTNLSNQPTEVVIQQKQQSNIKSVFLLFVLFIIFLVSASGLILPSARSWNRKNVRKSSKNSPKLTKTDIKSIFTFSNIF